ncbi:hypothetical protein [Pseudomonas phage Nerthus]|uniref:Uncharacterized protein n=1 Tax=Pseudomonas phage Nerthus TaxID=2163984 RepID=A0A2S1GMN7_9CAUD|nr:hypothetical protein HOT09_gp13 [Pseudomonas phage Nerthus]AWD90645.1 hypothetical protein [Pseudomonas phage Nerthus]
MARMTLTIEVDQLEDDADCDKLANQMRETLQEAYPYIEVNVLEVDGPELSL